MTAGELTSAMLDRAVEHGLAEGQKLDWKKRFPEVLRSADFPKDVAAMANSGGGPIVYAVKESDAAATQRADVEFGEGLERQIRAVAAAAISPPVLGLKIQQIGDAPPRSPCGYRRARTLRT